MAPGLSSSITGTLIYDLNLFPRNHISKQCMRVDVAQHIAGPSTPSCKRSRSEIEEVEQVQLDASEDDVVVWRVLNTQGDDLPIDIAFQRIALSIRGQRAVGTEVKLEIFEEMIVPVKNIAYTQRWCSNYFRGGPYAGEQLQVVIDYLISGAIDPLNDSWLTLDIVKRNGKLQSVDNRRLYCLKAWQAQEASKDIQARIRLRVWDPLFDRYLQHNETDSTSIRVRGLHSL